MKCWRNFQNWAVLGAETANPVKCCALNSSQEMDGSTMSGFRANENTRKNLGQKGAMQRSRK